MIGVFDSGFGGLTVLKEALKILPQYDYIYLGDSARAPYGSKSEEVIYNYTKEAVEFLFGEGCGLIIVACNTVSARALRKIQQEYLPSHFPDKKVLGVIIPLAEEAGRQIRFKRIGLVGTRATIESKTYESEIKKINSDVEIYSQACPLLVPLIEEGWTNRPETKMILRKYLRPLKEKKIDSLILGCTHYPILIKEIKAVLGRQIKVFDSPKIIAEKLADYLKRHPEIESKLKKNGSRIFFTTDDTGKFKNSGKKFLGEEIEEIKKIEL